MRALYGFCLVCVCGWYPHSVLTHWHPLCQVATSLGGGKKTKGENKVRYGRYSEWAKVQLKQKYQFVSNIVCPTHPAAMVIAPPPCPQDNDQLRIVEKALDLMTSSNR